ncbi:hypothetical protein ACSSPV_003918, partial [Escherichia coli]
MNKTITALTIIMASFAANASVLPETPVPFWICPYISRHLLSLNPLQAR